MLASNMLSTWKNCFLLGQYREYQEKWIRLFETWQDLCKKSFGYGGLGYNFSSSFWKNFSQYLPQFSFVPYSVQDMVKNMEKHLKCLDQCWEEVIHSEAYAKRSGEILESFMKFQKAWEDCCGIALENLPIASRQNLESVSEQIRKLQQRISELENRSE